MAVTEMPWPNATVAFLVPLHVSDGGQEAAGLARVARAGLGPQPELVEVGLQRLGLQRLADQDRPDVAGLRERAGHGAVEGGVLVAVLEVRVVARQPVGDDDRGRGRDGALLERRGHRHDLRGRPGLEHVRERQVAQLGALLADVGVGVEGRVGGDGEQVAVPDVLDDHGAGRRLGLLDALGQGVLRVPLQVRVDGEGDVVAVDRRLQRPLPHRDGCAVEPLLEGLPAGGALEVLLHHELDAAAGLLGSGHVADEGGGRRALRVGALRAGRLAVAGDTGDAQLGDRVPGQRRDVAAEDAVAAGAREVTHELGDRGVEQGGQLGRGRLHRGRGGRRVALLLAGAVGAHRLLVGDDGLAHHARGQHGAVGGEHLAAHGGDDLGGLPLGLGLLRDRRRVEALDADQLGAEDAEHEQAGHGEEPHPATRVAGGRAGGPGDLAAAGPGATATATPSRGSGTTAGGAGARPGGA